MSLGLRRTTMSASMHTPMICRPTPAVPPQTSKQLNIDCCHVLLTSTWMSSNRLKLNADKTEFIWLGTRQQLSKVVVTPLQVKDQLLQPTDTVRDLGMLIDSQLTMEAHVRNVVRSYFYQLQQLCSIRRSLSTDTRRTLTAAFIASRVDYCNGVLCGVSSQVIC